MGGTVSVVLREMDARGVATVTLNRPEIHNAYNGALIDALAAALADLAREPKLRAVVLKANGRHFSAGADLNWLRQAADFTPAQNLDFSVRTVEAVHALMAFPVPTLAVVQGACYGGGVGLVAACDMAVCAEDSAFALTEVRVGVNPAPIVRQAIAAAGVRHARRYLLTGERFDAAEARRIGLVHETPPREALDGAAAKIVDALLMGGPQAARETKALVLALSGALGDARERAALSAQAANRRASPEAREGLSAFLEKRRPGWAPPP